MAKGGQAERLRVLLIGKTGHGKSALGNTLLARNAFTSRGGMSATTKKFDLGHGSIDNVDIEVADTPGLTDTHHSDEFVCKEIAKSLSALSPGPHVVFMVCSAKTRFTPEEYNAYCKARQLLDEENLSSHIVVVFTGLDKLKLEKLEIQSEIKNGPRELKKMLEDVGNRYIAIDNMTQNTEEKQQQRTDLLRCIREVSPNESAHLTDELQEELNKGMQGATAKKAKEEGKTEQEARDAIKVEIIAESSRSLSLSIATNKVQKHAEKKKVRGCTIL